ncbi:MAG: hypothetical protein WA192_03420 [Candidatus Acidiferrales bacterium]
MKILVTFALENEFAPWRALRDFRAGKWCDASVHCARVGAADVGVVLTGAGPKQARLQASKVLRAESDSESAPVRLCISSGLAGALKSRYQIGQILTARSVRTEAVHDEDTADVLESSAPLLSFAAECDATVVDQFYSAERVVGRAEEKRHLGAHADAVEMESFEVLLAAAAFGIPAVAIRTVSDAVDDDLPLDMNRIFTDDGRLSVSRVLGQVAQHPASVPDLVRLGRNSKLAAVSLGHFLDRYIAFVAERFNPLELRAGVAAP